MEKYLTVVLSAVLMGVGVVVWDLMGEFKAVQMSLRDYKAWEYRIEQLESDMHVLNKIHTYPAHRTTKL